MVFGPYQFSVSGASQSSLEMSASRCFGKRLGRATSVLIARRKPHPLAVALVLLILAPDVGVHAQTYSVIYNFGVNGSNDITGPSGLIVGQDGNLYGVASGSDGFGELFKITPPGTASTLHSFDCDDGSLPNGLTYGSDGNLYGTTGNGHGCGYGSVFKITPNGSFATLSGAVVDIPLGPPIQATDGNLYGTACGLFYCYIGTDYGSIYKITPPGTLTTLYEFDQAYGAGPNPQLLEGTDGNFYGTTMYGGTNGDGVIFKVAPSGQLTVLYDFTTTLPSANALIEGTDGDFYGTTQQGGNISACPLYGCGTIFQITQDGSYTLLHTFALTDGMSPFGPLVQGKDGNLYGIAYSGGTSTACTGGCGVIFESTPQGNYSVLYNFDGTHGANPNNLVLAKDGNLYGTTLNGGTLPTLGTIFRLTPTGVFSNVYDFNGGTSGASPQSLVPSSNGNFFGVATAGGPEGAGCSGGCGVLYSLVLFDFSVGAAQFSPSSVSPGGSSTSTVNTTPVNGFSTAVAFSCSVQPTPALAPQCSISPTSAAPGTAATLTVTTTASTTGVVSGERLFYAICLPLAGFIGASVRFGSRRREKQSFTAMLLVGAASVGLIFGVACGGGGSSGSGSGGGSGTPAGSYTITVTGVSGFLQHSTSIKLTVQ